MRKTGRRVEPGTTAHGFHPKLTGARERHLLEAIHASRDRTIRDAARAELWESHAKLVVCTARRHQAPGVRLPRLISAGYLGLHEAIERFRPGDDGGRLAGHALVCISRHVREHADRCRASREVPAALAHRQAARLGPWLLARARRDCAREGVEPTDTELFARASRRMGLSIATAARLMTQTPPWLFETPAPETPRPGAAEKPPAGASITSLDHIRVRRRLILLASTLLGQRERVVFLARCLCVTGAMVPAVRLARALDVTPGRIALLEISARRKMATVTLAGSLPDLLGGAATAAPSWHDLEPSALVETHGESWPQSG